MLKYNLGDEVVYLKNNKIHTGKVIARKFLDTVKNYNYYMSDYDECTRVLGGNHTAIYIVNDGNGNHQYDERELFANDKELIDSLYEKEGA